MTTQPSRRDRFWESTLWEYVVVFGGLAVLLVVMAVVTAVVDDLAPSLLLVGPLLLGLILFCLQLCLPSEVIVHRDSTSGEFSVHLDDPSSHPALWLGALAIVGYAWIFVYPTPDPSEDAVVNEIRSGFEHCAGRFIRWFVVTIATCECLMFVVRRIWSRRHWFVGPDFTPSVLQVARRRTWGFVYRYVGLLLIAGFVIVILVVFAYQQRIPEQLVTATALAVFIVSLLIVSVPAVVFLTRDTLLKTCFPTLYCPACREQMVLVGEWECPGGCKLVRARHVLTGCPQCGTKHKGIDCLNEHCHYRLLFSDTYNEFEILNRDHKYVTVTNQFYWAAIGALVVFSLGAYICHQVGNSAARNFFLVNTAISGVGVVKLRPKRLLKNPFFYEEAANQQCKTETAT